MNTFTKPGSFVFPTATGQIPPSTIEELEAAVQILAAHKDIWIKQSIPVRYKYLETMCGDFASIARAWVEQVTVAQKITAQDGAIGSEWMSGPYAVLRNIRCLQRALLDIQSTSYPRLSSSPVIRPNGQLAARVFPQTIYDRLLFNGYKAEVWFEPQVNLENFKSFQAQAYHNTDLPGKLAMVLGAGNLAGIPVTDVLDRLFVQNQVVILKMNPVNDFMGPLFAHGFRCLIEAGFLRIVYGGIEEGAFLCQHGEIDEIFITGSDKTFEAIVFGTGESGARRKAERQPLLNKPVSGELGNVTPAIIIPGDWSQEDLAYQAENLVSWIISNASAACNTPRVIVLHAGWSLRSAFLDALRKCFAQTPLRYAFYPGSQERYRAFLDAHPNAEKIGHPQAGELPWTIIRDVELENLAEICFKTEAFCSVVAILEIEADDIPHYLERAVAFANQKLWGTLAAGLFVHPKTLQDARIKAAYEQALQDLQYGTVSVNCPAGLSWVMMTTPWGAYPGHDIYDIQSGNSFVHNTLMFSAIQKTVLYGKFHEKPKPIAFASRGSVIRDLGPLLTDFMLSPSPWKLPRILARALRAA